MDTHGYSNNVIVFGAEERGREGWLRSAARERQSISWFLRMGKTNIRV
jgi:hypothetical protein